MTSSDLLILVIIVIGSAITAVLITVAGSSLIQAHRVQIEPLLGDARLTIVAALSGSEQLPAMGAFAGSGRLARRYITEVMLDLAPSITGTSRSILVSLGEDIGVLSRARAGVLSRRWSVRLYSARVLTAFGVESDQLGKLFADRSPEVRAQAAAWSVASPSTPSIRQLIDLLDDADGLCRFSAQDALIRIGLRASEALMDALGTATGDMTVRLLEVAAATGDDRFYQPALAFTSDPSPATRASAAAVLSNIGNPNAGPRLVLLLGDPSEAVVMAAAKGIAKLAYWPAAADIEVILSHPSWEVRKQAGLTLLALGAPGAILLSVTAPGEGSAAEMATQALQLRSLSVQSGAI